jgi:ADP-ribose pyrophosphatase YjhB (NUDIX family)
VTHVTAEVLAPLVERFGAPAEWDGSRDITATDASTLHAGSDPDRRHDVTFVILDQEGRTVVIRKPQFPTGAWRIPSGGIRQGETVIDGTAREALEETGLNIEMTGYPLVARSVFTHRGHPDPWTTHVVTAVAAAGVLAPRDTVEIEAVRWMALGDLTGAVAEILRRSGSGLLSYRADLHDRIVRLLTA